jgi:hypothetical protein
VLDFAFVDAAVEVDSDKQGAVRSDHPVEHKANPVVAALLVNGAG